MKKIKIFNSVKQRAAAAVLSFVILFAAAPFFPETQKASGLSYITIDPGTAYQTMDGWGTSLSWWGNAVGGWDMIGSSGQEKREELAQLVFGKDGLNMNIARYNVGAGDNPQHQKHMNDYRQLPVFKESADSEYDWDADARQVWMFKRANEIRQEAAGTGEESDMINEIFANSAPWWMTNSTCGSGDGALSTKYTVKDNLADNKRADYITYFADVVEHFIEDENLPIHYAEPLNEPSSGYWKMFSDQEGMDVSVSKQSAYYVDLYNKLNERGLIGNPVELTGIDETSNDNGSGNGSTLNSWNQLSTPAKSAISKINTHLYTNSPAGRAGLREIAYGSTPNYTNPNKKLWMSEICYNDGAHDHNSMDIGLGIMSSDIYNEMYDSHASAWITWQAVETEMHNLMYGNNYGLIHGVYQDAGEEYNYPNDRTNMRRGDYYPTKQYYTMGHYSRYIEQGYSIINVSGASGGTGKTVAAISPDKKTVVIVSPNTNAEAEPVNYFLKGFNAESGYKVVTDAGRNWETEPIEASGSYISDNLDPRSMTTIVLNGTYESGSSNSGIYLESFAASGTGLFAEYYVTDTAGSANYKLYYSTTPGNLPCNGGTGAQSVTLTDKAAGKNTLIQTVPSLGYGVYYGVVEFIKNGVTTYSRVISTAGRSVTSDYTYLVSPGKTAKSSYSGIDYASFGANYGVADKAFGPDPFTGKNWGYTTASTTEYNSNDPLTACRISNGNSLTYKFEVDNSLTDHSVLVTFNDPQRDMRRGMTLNINGAEAGTVDNALGLECLYADGVNGVSDSGKYYITIEVTTPAESPPPLINLISIQQSGQPEKTIAVKAQTVQIEREQSVLQALPDSADIITSAGIETYSGVVRYDSISYGDIQQNGGVITIKGRLPELSRAFDVTVFINNSLEDYYYFISAGESGRSGEPISSSTAAELAAVAGANSTLINSNVPDRTYEVASGTPSGGWGRIYSTSTYSDFFAVHYAGSGKWEAVLDGKKGGSARGNIRYYLPGLESGKSYTMELGLYDPWNNTRNMNVYINGTASGNMITSYTRNGVAVSSSTITVTAKLIATIISFDVTADSNGVIDFRLMHTGTGANDNALMSWLAVKDIKGTPSSDVPATPVLPRTISGTSTEITVGGVEEGALLALTDLSGRLIADHIVTLSEAVTGSATLTGLDLTVSTTLIARQYKGYNVSAPAEADVPQLNCSEPRKTWGTKADVITCGVYTKDGVQSLEYRFEGGQWHNIIEYNYFRASRNGKYEIKMITKSKTEVVREINVTHIDTLDLKLDNDLSQWVSGSLQLKIKPSSSTRGLSSVEISTNGGVSYAEITQRDSSSNYVYRLRGNSDALIRLTSLGGTTAVFPINVNNIETAVPTLGISLSNAGGVMTADLDAYAQSGYKMYVSRDGGDSLEVFDSGYKLIRSGRYDFMLVSSSGRMAHRTVTYYAKPDSDALARVQIGELTDGVINVRLAVDGDVESFEVVRVDGSGGTLKPSGGFVKITSNGQYQIISTDSAGNIEIVTFTITRFKGADSGAYEPSPSMGAGAAVGIAIGCSAAAAAAALVVLFFISEKKRVKKEESV